MKKRTERKRVDRDAGSQEEEKEQFQHERGREGT